MNQYVPAHAGTAIVAMALFGSFADATCEPTHLATLHDGPLRLSVIDIGWGTVVSVASPAAGTAAPDWSTRGTP